MSSSTYKEDFRRQMVRWGEALRRKDPTVFCRKALEYLIQDSLFKPAFVIVADCRRPTDLEYFSSLNKDTPLLHLRISASPVTRRTRGWMYTSGIDDAETECALDRAPFDVLVVNESQRTLNLSMVFVRRALSDNPLRKIMTIWLFTSLLYSSPVYHVILAPHLMLVLEPKLRDVAIGGLTCCIGFSSYVTCSCFSVCFI